MSKLANFAGEVVEQFCWGLILVMIYNTLFAPLRWLFGLRKIGFTINSGYGGYLIAVFGFMPLFWILGGVFLLHDGSSGGMTTEMVRPFFQPLMSFVAAPIAFALFILFMKWETIHYNRQQAEANQLTPEQNELLAELWEAHRFEAEKKVARMSPEFRAEFERRHGTGLL